MEESDSVSRIGEPISVCPAGDKPTTAAAPASTVNVQDGGAERAGLEPGGGGPRRNRQDRKKHSKKDPERGSSRGGSCGGRGGAHHLASKFRGCRKRAHSFPSLSKFFLPHKRPRKEAFIPPTKFLLGGNISDPLNLNSLQDEDVNRAMNAVTPESSPLPTPPRHKAKVDVIIPPDCRDPLNLIHPLSDDEYEKRLATQRGRRARKRAKTKRRASESAAPPAPAVPPSSSATASAAPAAPATPPVAAPLPPVAAPPPRAVKRTSSECESAPVKPKDNKKLRRLESLDKIVSPVVPQPGAWRRARPPLPPRTHRPALHAPSAAPAPTQPHKPPTFHAKDERYQYGNYDRYYGYRNLPELVDVRLRVFQRHRHLFHNKDILDIGCNVGHVSIAVARTLGARFVTGVDIDHTLIGRARANLKSYVSVPAAEQTAACGACGASGGERCEACRETGAAAAHAHCAAAAAAVARRQKKKKNRKGARGDAAGGFYFPVSFSLLYGPIELPPPPAPAAASAAAPRPFPHNVVFKQANYVLKDEALLGAGGGGGADGAGAAQYDLVLCLSTTKWLHLNWGDAGLKLAFRRMFAELRPGGKLVLEAQNWASYKKKKCLTPQIYNNYNAIEFFPHKFKEYLLSPEVGFSRCVVLGTPQHTSKGFRRPVQLFIKGDFTPSKAQWSDAYAPPSSQHAPDAPPPRRTVYVAAASPRSPYSPRSPAAAAPYSPRSPFYTPRSDSYAPSYSQARDTGARNVYAALGSPLPDASPRASPASPAAPFLEPSPGHSHRACTPSHSASAAHKYALRSPAPPLSSSPAPDDSSLD